MDVSPRIMSPKIEFTFFFNERFKNEPFESENMVRHFFLRHGLSHHCNPGLTPGEVEEPVKSSTNKSPGDSNRYLRN